MKNIVNSKGEFTPAEGYDRYFTNDHPRMAPFSRVRSIQNDTYFYTYPMDAPRGVVDSLTDTSKPAAELYNALADGSKLMGKPVYNIEKDDDGNISFTFMTKEKETDAIRDIAMAEDTTGDDTVYDITGKKADRTSAGPARNHTGRNKKQHSGNRNRTGVLGAGNRAFLGNDSGNRTEGTKWIRTWF